MKQVRKLGLSLLLSSFVLLSGAAGSFAAPKMTNAAPVKVAMVAKFGDILTTPMNQALYYWDNDKNGKPTCTGACAKSWPPLLVSSAMMVPHAMKGIMGAFGEVTRPDGTHQLTFDKHPLYRFTGDVKPLQVLCDGVDGWHVVRLMH
jgi:predicted lipoprotein with Yx(FWY)xxD motif